MKDFKVTGDKELRVVKYTGWAIPVYAYPGLYMGTPHWCVTSAMHLDPDAHNVLQIAAGAHAVAKIDRFWVIPDHLFPAERASGVNPSYYFYDPRKDEPSKPDISAEVEEEPIPDSGHGDDFVREVWQRTAVADLPTMRMVWHALCQEMPRWMIQHKKPVNLGWVRLVALPYRANWKAILLGRFPNIWSLLRHSKAEREAKIALTDLPIEMSTTSYLALVKAGRDAHTIRWTVEADLDECWMGWVDQYEKAVLENTNETKYLKRCADLLRSLRPMALAVFRNWVSQTRLPSGAVVTRHMGRGKRLVEDVEEGRVRPSNAHGIPIFVTTPSDASEIRNGFDGKIVDTETEDLPELPVVDFDTQNMWKSGGNVRDERGEKAAGLLVPPPAGSQTPEEGLLGEGDGPPVRMG